MSLVSDIIKDVLVFRDILRENATKKSRFTLEKHTSDITIDVVGRVTLLVFETPSSYTDCSTLFRDTGLNTLRSHNDMVAVLRSQITWSIYGNGATMKLLNPFRHLVQRYNSYRMDR